MSREAEIVEAFQRIAAKQRFFSVEDVNGNWNPSDYHGAPDLSAGGRLATVRAVLRTLEALGMLRCHHYARFHFRFRHIRHYVYKIYHEFSK